MIVDAASGAVHSVDEVAYDAIGMLDEAVRGSDGGAGKVFEDISILETAAEELMRKHGIDADDANETLDDIAGLHSAGLLWSEDPFDALQARVITAERAGS